MLLRVTGQLTHAAVLASERTVASEEAERLEAIRSVAIEADLCADVPLQGPGTERSPSAAPCKPLVATAMSTVRVTFAGDPILAVSPYESVPRSVRRPSARYLADNERTSPGLPDADTYNTFLMERWQALLDGEDSREETCVAS